MLPERRAILPGLAFAAAGSINATLAAMGNLWELLETAAPGHVRPLLTNFTLDYFLFAMAVWALPLRFGTNAAQQVARPLRFLLTMSASTAVFSAIGSALRIQWCCATANWLGIALVPFAQAWASAMLWCTLIGWLFLLFMQRREDQRRLDTLMAQRALQARQQRQQQRAEAIDPLLIADTLRAVHTRYLQAPAGGAGLLDQLVHYLRLAMDRKRSGSAGRDEAESALRAAILETPN